ncbi:hypothetical protein EDF56_1104 [Novosphingobium sp. PhB165]|nr:hypothetical protein EDF56_1104 [Novosphingobium sp. PhB165]
MSVRSTAMLWLIGADRHEKAASTYGLIQMAVVWR